jgi:hypothetical protein
MNNLYSEIKKVQMSDCPSSLSEVICRYSPVFLSMYSKYQKSITSSGADPNDILLDKDLIIYESAKTFDIEKGSSFCTWLSNNTKYRCLHLMSKSLKILKLSEKIKTNMTKDSESQPFRHKELNSHIFFILNELKDKRISSVYKLRYFSEANKMTWSKIGKRMGFSSQTAINLHRKGAEILKRKINKINS